MEEYNGEKREQEIQKKTRLMFDFAREVGSGSAVTDVAGELWFKTWQEALDFQKIAREERGIELTLIEADPKPTNFAGEYYRLKPKI